MPAHFSSLMRESWLLLAGGAVLFLIMALFTYNENDSAWSHQSGYSEILNMGGQAGAYLSDILFYSFGSSAWWLVLGLFALIVWIFRRVKVVNGSEKRPLVISSLGFLTLVIASSAFEALRLYSYSNNLPAGPGGVIGDVISSGALKLFGFTGGTLLLLICMAIGVTLVFGVSWIEVFEKVGKGLESSVKKMWGFVESWKDRKMGQAATMLRDKRVRQAKERFIEKAPLKINTIDPKIPQSERVSRERQKILFDDMPDSELPPLNLLDDPPSDQVVLSEDTLEYTSRLIEKKLMDFGIEVRVVTAQPGPVVTRYEIDLAIGIKGSQVINLVKDLARSLSVASVRVVETIPGKTHMGLEIPNQKRHVVRLSEILSSEVYAELRSVLTLALGKDISGKPVVADLAKMPHLLVAGTTGSGKSVAINAMILSLLYKSTALQVRLILIDPKMLELSVYEGIPHLLTPVVTDMKQAAHALGWCVAEMDRRYKLMSALGVRNIAGYNQKIRDAKKSNNEIDDPFSDDPENPDKLSELPLVVVVIDELADLIMVVGKKVEELIARLAQKARAAGLHLILATQRPSVDVITGLIKANIPTRIGFQVSSKVDSRTILDQMGAEQLLGQGDMLYLPPGTGYPQRVHGAFVADSEVHAAVEYMKSKGGDPKYISEVLEPSSQSSAGSLGQGDEENDPLYDQAVEVVIKSRRASISAVQRQLRIGYNRAARLIEQMEQAGLVSSMGTNGNREVLVPPPSDV